MESKLILVEGIPGSGKTTTAQFVAAWLAEKGVETAVFLEGDLNHPADFESVACLDSRAYADLKDQFPNDIPFLEQHLSRDGDDYFFRYRALQLAYPGLSEALVTALARYEIYELPVPTFQRLLRRRWQQFAAAAAGENKTIIFECCFLQNPLTMLLGRNDEPTAVAQAFVLELADIVQPLAPRWIYLRPRDVRAALARVAGERPAEWLAFVIAYHTQQGHGLAQGWQGFDGLVQFYEMRQAVELALLPQLPFPGLVLEPGGWPQDQTRLARFLGQMTL